MSPEELFELSSADVTEHHRIAAELLTKHIRPSHIRDVVRRPAGTLDGRSLLELAHKQPTELLDCVQRMFNFGDVQG